MKSKPLLIGIKILIFIFLLTFVVSSAALDIQGKITSRLELEEENSEIPLTRNQLELEFSSYSPRSGMAKAVVAVDDMDKNLILKKVYGEFYLDETDVKIGKQRIVWGKTDGLNPTDNFNPEDMTRPFVDDNKIAIPAVRAKHYYQDWIFDVVWAPRFEAPKFARAGERWSVIPRGIIDPIIPEAKIENSEFGIRVSHWTPAIDISYSYFRGYSKDPYFPSQPVERNGEYVWHLKFYRINVLGGDFAKDFGSFVVRGEGAYFQPEASFKSKKPYYKVVLGCDSDLTDKLYGNIQYYREKEEDKKEVQMITLATEYEITAFKKLELNTVYNLDKNDYVFNPVYAADIMDGVSLSIGGYIFAGDKGTQFGTFAERDYGYIELEKAF